MKKAYIILAHKYPRQLKRLVDRLDDNNNTAFFIHIDQKVPQREFKATLGERGAVRFIESVNTHWGGFGLVEATLNAMKAVKDSDENFDRIILMSGQDYPIKSNKQIDDFFASSSHTVFIDHFALPNYLKWSRDGGMYRVNKYFFGLSGMHKFAAKTSNLLASVIPRIRRKMPNGMLPYSGSQWWVMDMHALNYVLDYTERNPDYLQFHKHTFAPDELYFQMILLNADDSRISRNINNDSLRFMKWRSSSTAHPEILNKHDIKDIQTSPALFARKFDEVKYPEILDMIDEKCLV